MVPPGLDNAVTAVRRWTSDRHNWVRVGWFAAGMVLLIGGVSTFAARPAAAAASSAAGAARKVI
jgi:hypothetical protein